MGPRATTRIMRRSSVPCGRSKRFSVTITPFPSTYTPGYVEGQGIMRISRTLFGVLAETGVRGREIRVIGDEFRLSLSHHSLQNHSCKGDAVGNNRSQARRRSANVIAR